MARHLSVVAAALYVSSEAVQGSAYDPAVLGTSDQRSITADADLAHDWYEKAAQLGSAEAKQRLTQLQN